jgi:hypothetical protein
MLTPGNSLNVLRSIEDAIQSASSHLEDSDRYDSLWVSKLDHKRLDAMLLAVDDELRKDGAVCSCRGCSSDPPLCRADVRGVDHKLVRLLLKRGRRLQSSLRNRRIREEDSQ